jgi:hypothetical protein
MLTIETTLNAKVLDVTISRIQATPAVIQQIVVSHVQPALDDYMRRELQPYPRPIGAGVFKRFATRKQLRYVMAKIRRGEWTGRTGALGQAWVADSEAIQLGAVVRIRNTSKVATYIVGRRQQAFHADTGWPDVPNAHVDNVRRLARDTFVGAYFDANSNSYKVR